MVSKNKKAFFYFVELIVFILLVTLIWSQFPVVQQSYLDLEEQENLRAIGYNTLKSLDDAKVLCSHINTGAFTSSNFTSMRANVEHALPTTVGYKITYLLSKSTCYSQDGNLVAPGEVGTTNTCGFNMSTDANVVSVFYTCPKLGIPVTIKLYLWRLFGGHFE